jgi:AcrR family transcriptional regulator
VTSATAALGNKEALFKKALERYEAKRDAFFAEAFAAPTAREAIARLLDGTVELLSDKHAARLSHGAGRAVRR